MLHKFGFAATLAAVKSGYQTAMVSTRNDLTKALLLETLWPSTTHIQPLSLCKGLALISAQGLKSVYSLMVEVCAFKVLAEVVHEDVLWNSSEGLTTIHRGTWTPYFSFLSQVLCRHACAAVAVSKTQRVLQKAGNPQRGAAPLS